MTARGETGCSSTSSCTPQPGTVEVEAHVIFAGTRVASAKPTRTLYYYRTRLGTVIATSLSGGRPGAAYRYTPYGEVEFAVGETDETRSELGYTNALRLSGSLLYLKARVYDTQARVFIQADDVDRLRYAYVQGDPVNASDPTGLMPLGPGATVMLDGLMLAGPLGDCIAERMMMVSHQQAVDVAPSNEVQTQGESAVHKPDGIGLADGG